MNYNIRDLVEAFTSDTLSFGKHFTVSKPDADNKEYVIRDTYGEVICKLDQKLIDQGALVIILDTYLTKIKEVEELNKEKPPYQNTAGGVAVIEHDARHALSLIDRETYFSIESNHRHEPVKIFMANKIDYAYQLYYLLLAVRKYSYVTEVAGQIYTLEEGVELDTKASSANTLTLIMGRDIIMRYPFSNKLTGDPEYNSVDFIRGQWLSKEARYIAIARDPQLYMGMRLAKLDTLDHDGGITVKEVRIGADHTFFIVSTRDGSMIDSEMTRDLNVLQVKWRALVIAEELKGLIRKEQDNERTSKSNTEENAP